MIREPYQGWTNYPTWAVSLWLNNDEPLYRQLQSLIRQSDGEAYELAQSLKNWVIDDLTPDLAPSFAGDILGWAMEQVNWDEIAASELSE
jgi:hypothetical protein